LDGKSIFEAKWDIISKPSKSFSQAKEPCGCYLLVDFITNPVIA